jgi:hypothetical protein
VYQQAILYRVVMLARGVRLAWNAQNILLSFLAARALMETLAVFDDLEGELSSTAECEDLEATDRLVMNRTFSTRDGELLQDHPELLAINVLTFIDKLEQRYGIPIRNHYNSLSERCHPNSAGHHQMYSTTDRTNGTVTFSETKNPDMSLDYIRAPLGLLFCLSKPWIVLTA